MRIFGYLLYESNVNTLVKPFHHVLLLSLNLFSIISPQNIIFGKGFFFAIWFE